MELKPVLDRIKARGEEIGALRKLAELLKEPKET